MSYYLATHEHSGNALFSDRSDAKQWVEYQADYHRQEIGAWTTHGEEESLRLADGKAYAGTVRSMTLDKHAEHRQYEAEQRAEMREAREAAEAAEVERLRAQVAELASALAVGGAEEDSHEAKVAEYLSSPYTDDTTDQEPDPATTADKAAALDMTPTEYRKYRHDAAVEQIRKAAGGLLAETGLRVMDALDGATGQQPCGSRSLPTYSGEVVRCVLTVGHAGQCQSAAEYPYVSWPNPASGVWNRQPEDDTTEEATS